MHVTRDRIPSLLARAIPASEDVNTDPIDFVVANYSMIDRVCKSAVESVFISVPSISHASIFRKLLPRVNSYIVDGVVPRFCVFAPITVGISPRVEICRYLSKEIEKSVHVVCCPASLIE